MNDNNNNNITDKSIIHNTRSIQNDKENADKVYIGCIGSAGRGTDKFKMTKQLYKNMIWCFNYIVGEILHLDNVQLVSGGAALSDHIAVEWYLKSCENKNNQNINNKKDDKKDNQNNKNSKKYNNKENNTIVNYQALYLYLPCDFDEEQQQFFDNGKTKWYENPGQIANHYHREFAKKCCDNSGDHNYSLQQLQKSWTQYEANKIVDTKGFHARNKAVASLCDILIAFTWGTEEDGLKDGGSAHTWTTHKIVRKDALRIHIPLSYLEFYDFDEYGFKDATAKIIACVNKQCKQQRQAQNMAELENENNDNNNKRLHVL